MRNFLGGNRGVLLAVTVAVLVPVSLFAAGEWYRGRDYQRRFLDLHGGLQAADIVLLERRDGHRLYDVHLDNGVGLAVRGLLKVPDGPATRRPALLILGGVRTGRRTIEYLPGTRGVILLALDYPYEGKKERLSPWEFLVSMESMRRAVIRTVPAVMLGVDYLLTRDDVDGGRIVLVGGSVGAVFTPAAAAADTRIAAAAMLFGAGDVQAIMRANLEIPGLLAAPASWLGAVLTSPVEPLKYIGRVSPRPVYMLNGTGDPRMPEGCSRRLHEAAQEPKTIRWIDTGHVNVRDAAFHQWVGRELAAWLSAEGLVDPGSLSQP